MVPLDAAQWKELEHAYGPASDVPDLLGQLEEDPKPRADSNDEPWFSLWSCLCHQDDAYTASYAAVPHIVRIGMSSTEPIDFSFFLLPAAIEIARASGRGPRLPAPLAEAYLVALRQLHDCAFRHAAENWDQSMVLSVAAALAAAKGQIKVAEAILNLDEDWMDRIVAGNR